MKKLLAGALGAAVIVAALAAALLQAGDIDAAADVPHSPLVYRLIEWARERSVARQLRAISVPENVVDPERVRRGAGNYAAMCVDCHLSPGRADTEIRKGLYPQPPNLSLPVANAAQESAPERRFWIIKHGLKASGMPAWSKAGMEDEAIWDLVAFVKVLPSLSPEAYRQQVAASDGHRHGNTDAASAGAAAADHHPSTAHEHRHAHAH